MVLNSTCGAKFNTLKSSPGTTKRPQLANFETKASVIIPEMVIVLEWRGSVRPHNTSGVPCFSSKCSRHANKHQRAFNEAAERERRGKHRRHQLQRRARPLRSRRPLSSRLYSAALLSQRRQLPDFYLKKQLGATVTATACRTLNKKPPLTTSPILHRAAVWRLGDLDIFHTAVTPLRHQRLRMRPLTSVGTSGPLGSAGCDQSPAAADMAAVG